MADEATHNTLGGGGTRGGSVMSKANSLVANSTGGSHHPHPLNNVFKVESSPMTALIQSGAGHGYQTRGPSAGGKPK